MRYKSSDNVTKTFCSVGDYPRIVSGKNACQPEDCGGPWGYGNLLKVLAGRNSAQKRELLEWLDEVLNYQRRLSIRIIRKLLTVSLKTKDFLLCPIGHGENQM